MLDMFQNWINENKLKTSGYSEKEIRISETLSAEASLSLDRMRKGLEVLKKNNDARLAFCIANKTMGLQYTWSKKGGNLTWRPFQIAYFLLTVESVYNENSTDRDICDLLWVATGGGKTEAYLAIVAFTVILRRIRNLSTADEGYGTSVITRYTLRLLAIQQFRRSLSLITALEYLRVKQVQTGFFGWRPKGYTGSEKFVLGTRPFTIGLWVGGGVTPNSLEGNSKFGDGALDKLKNPISQKNSSEPAQITNCPACDSVLSIPDDGFEKGIKTLFIVIKASGDELKSCRYDESINYKNVNVYNIEILQNLKKSFFTVKFELELTRSIDIKETESIIIDVIKNLQNKDNSVKIASSSCLRPGYFLRNYINKNGKTYYYNFDIFCPNPDCPLSIEWFAETPTGLIHNRTVEDFQKGKHVSLIDGLILKDIIEPFQHDNMYYSNRIQIPALTVDEQIYRDPPAVLLSTVDKFARPAFEPRFSSIFGNFDYYHSIYGYYRKNLHGIGSGEHPSPIGGKENPLYVKVKFGSTPDLILQDELHLLEGPLGGMVGIYETAFDYLVSEDRNRKIKYIASTATIRNADDQVKAIFSRNVYLFPPFGDSSDDRFFIRESEISPFEDKKPGRLYLGIVAPGRGPLTPILRIWARVLQSGWENSDSPEIDRFWTVTGYFNSIRELAGSVALYRQDIPQQLNVIGKGNSRPIDDGKKVELSSRRNSTELPSLLQIISRNYTPNNHDAIDALFTTSMFGTGIDISRLGLMIVNGQPKTTSAYIQSTGRIGRSSGGLIITFLRSSRPRDLSHYEYFTGYHRQLHRFVEPVSAFPFAPKVSNRSLGPISVLILRNTRSSNVPWYLDEYAGKMPQFWNSCSTTKKLGYIFEERAQGQPVNTRQVGGMIKNEVETKINKWINKNNFSKERNRTVSYVEYGNTEKDVVLGDALHRRSKDSTTVFDDAPESLRDIEETTSFET